MAADGAAPLSRRPQGRGNSAPRWLRAGSREVKLAAPLALRFFHVDEGAPHTSAVSCYHEHCAILSETWPFVGWIPSSGCALCGVALEGATSYGLGWERYAGLTDNEDARACYGCEPAGLSTEVPVHMRRMADVHGRIGILRSG